MNDVHGRDCYRCSKNRKCSCTSTNLELYFNLVEIGGANVYQSSYSAIS